MSINTDFNDFIYYLSRNFNALNENDSPDQLNKKIDIINQRLATFVLNENSMEGLKKFKASIVPDLNIIKRESEGPSCTPDHLSKLVIKTKNEFNVFCKTFSGSLLNNLRILSNCFSAICENDSCERLTAKFNEINQLLLALPLNENFMDAFKKIQEVVVQNLDIIKEESKKSNRPSDRLEKLVIETKDEFRAFFQAFQKPFIEKNYGLIKYPPQTIINAPLCLHDRTLLQQACEDANIDFVKWLVANDAGFDITYKNNLPPVILVCHLFIQSRLNQDEAKSDSLKQILKILIFSQGFKVDLFKQLGPDHVPYFYQILPFLKSASKDELEILVDSIFEIKAIDESMIKSDKSNLINGILNLIHEYQTTWKEFNLIRRKNNQPEIEGRSSELAAMSVKEQLLPCYAFLKEKQRTVLIDVVKDLIRQGEGVVDKHGLLKGKPGEKLIPESVLEWHLNFGLLMNVYNKTTDLQLKKKISFLAFNYLAKAAPIGIPPLPAEDIDSNKLENMFHQGITWGTLGYHREVNEFQAYLEPIIAKVCVTNHGDYSLTDNIDYQQLFPPFFKVIVQDLASDVDMNTTINGWANAMCESIIPHFKKHKDAGFRKVLDLPFLFDFSSLLDTLMMKDKQALYDDKLEEIEKTLVAAVKKTILTIREAIPDLLEEGSSYRMESFIEAHMVSICRSKIQDLGVLWELPLPRNSGFSFSSRPLRTRKFVNYSGIRIGAVRAREEIFKFMNMDEFLKKWGQKNAVKSPVEYSVKGKTDVAYTVKEITVEEITGTNIFRKLLEPAQKPLTSLKKAQLPLDGANTSPEISPAKIPEEIRILGQSTLNLIEGFLKEISKEVTKEVHQINNPTNPEIQELFQTILFRMMNHLATAKFYVNDFSKFSQAIELVHCELATLLALNPPFKEGAFENIFRARLKIIPPVLKDFVRVGVSKSAMNTFAAINAAIYRENPKPERVFGGNAYFEVESFVGEDRSINEVLSKGDVKKIDLYIGEFNHNISLVKTHSHYEASDLGQDIDKILNRTSATPDQHLTIAVDCTIDFINSEKVQALLERFADRIKRGDLNFVFFRSGQKFDMLGMDNYYGSIFYTVNNNSKKWESFNKQMSLDSYKTDPLSMQWFSLSFKYALDALDDYRRAIFNNARAILDKVPPTLNQKPGKKGADQTFVVSAVDPKMNPSFIEIKIHGYAPLEKAERLQAVLFKKFTDKGAKIHQRVSFGFFHPNLNIIPHPTDESFCSFRINPGLSPEDNAIIIDFLKNDLVNIQNGKWPQESY